MKTCSRVAGIKADSELLFLVTAQLLHSEEDVFHGPGLGSQPCTWHVELTLLVAAIAVLCAVISHPWN